MKILNQDLKSREFKKAYLLYGDEAYLRRYYVNAFRDKILGDDRMNLLELEGKEPDLGALRDFTDTMPLFAEKRLVILRDTGLFKASSEEYAEWIGSLPDTAVVIFSEEEADKRNRLYKRVSENGYAAELSTPDEQGKGAFVQRFLKAHDMKITRDAYDLLLSRLTGGLDSITNELEKLLGYAGEGGSVRAEDVRAVITESTEIRVFDLTDALSEGRTERAFDIYYSLLREREPAMRLLFLISRQFSQLYSIKRMASEGLRDDDVAKTLAIRSPYVVKRLRRTADRFTEERLLSALTNIRRTEEDVKTGNLAEAPALEILMISLCE
ncbi:MAG: DNA polymerase III subunit delta [Lachnospiraceae bacterium]|nr:DNA polymerase III subunit delta [Lachnospiraceae bacterium]